jgi:thiosulfate/3-mercaptopyruvate sulfurtransferase
MKAKTTEDLASNPVLKTHSIVSAPIVSATWLSQHLDDPQTIVIDCRFELTNPQAGRQHYEVSHIPGAFYFDLNQDLSSPVGQHGGRHPLPDPGILAAKLTAIGIFSSSASSSVETPTQVPTQVILYDDSRLAYAARAWWLLRYLGHEQVAVLNGGWGGWQTAGHPVTAALPTPRSGNFIPRIQPNWVVGINEVKALKDLPTVALVDSREGDRYRGEREPIDPVAGHIPGAVNYPWQEVTDEQGYLRSPTEQQQRWAALAGEALAEGTDAPAAILVYCGSGVTACVNLLSLELAGIETGKLYAGSWSDWCSYLQPTS